MELYEMCKKFALSIAIVTVCIGIKYSYYVLQRVPQLPELDFDRWWGEGNNPNPNQEDKSIRPFKIVFNNTMIDDLKSRLKNRRPFTRPLEGKQSEYGINTIYLEEKILKYWTDQYNFTDRAEHLNMYPHFKTKIQGLDIHYIRMKPEANNSNKRVLPLLLVHGWPSSSKEFYKVIPMLTTPRSGYDFVFEVIAVDLPGFGFSEGTNKPGLSALQMGIILRNLMKRLGFNKYYIQAGDWGSQAATHLSTVFQDEVLGFHSNIPVSLRPISVIKYIIGSLFPSLIVEDKYRNRMYPITDYVTFVLKESGYFHLQTTKPDTIGAALADTPAGLAAYILEKIGVGSNWDQLHTPHGGLDEINIDDLLDTVTIMWANERITTSMRIYAESVIDWLDDFIVDNIPTFVPMAAINFRYEIIYQPDWILRDKFPNLVHSTIHDFGGHFAAIQTPKELVDDIFESVVAFIKFHERNRSTLSR